jgi:hypothetical protein
MGIWIGRDGRDDPATGTPPEGVRAGPPPEEVVRTGMPPDGVRGTGRWPAPGPIPCCGTSTAGVPTMVGAAAEPCWGRLAAGVPVGGPCGAGGGAPGAAGAPGIGAELPGSLAPGGWNISMVFLAAEAGPSDLPVSGQNFVPSSWSLPQ